MVDTPSLPFPEGSPSAEASQPSQANQPRPEPQLFAVQGSIEELLYTPIAHRLPAIPTDAQYIGAKRVHALRENLQAARQHLPITDLLELPPDDPVLRAESRKRFGEEETLIEGSLLQKLATATFAVQVGKFDHTHPRILALVNRTETLGQSFTGQPLERIIIDKDASRKHANKNFERLLIVGLALNALEKLVGEDRATMLMFVPRIAEGHDYRSLVANIVREGHPKDRQLDRFRTRTIRAFLKALDYIEADRAVARARQDS